MDLFPRQKSFDDFWLQRIYFIGNIRQFDTRVCFFVLAMKLAEGLDEFDQGGRLAGVGLMMTEVTDEADADSDFI